MTIAHDTATVATAYTSTGTQTTSHTGSASTKAVVVLIDQNGSTADQVSGVTYGGTAMKRLDTNSESTEAGRVYTYYLINPPTGTQNVAMTTTGTADKQLVCATMTGSAYKTIKLAGGTPWAFTGTSASTSNPSWNITGLTAGAMDNAVTVGQLKLTNAFDNLRYFVPGNIVLAVPVVTAGNYTVTVSANAVAVTDAPINGPYIINEGGDETGP